MREVAGAPGMPKHLLKHGRQRRPQVESECGQSAEAGYQWFISRRGDECTIPQIRFMARRQEIACEASLVTAYLQTMMAGEVSLFQIIGGNASGIS